jgi:hypothetical protein
MIFFKIIILFSSFCASVVTNFNKQIFFNYLFSTTMMLFLMLKGHYLFAFVFVITELLINKLVILGNNNSRSATFPSFRTFKKDFKKYVLGFLTLLICMQTYVIFNDFGNEGTYQLMRQFERFSTSLPTFAMAIFILTITRWNKLD